MIKRVVLRALLSLVLLLMTLISLATVMLVTEPGTRWLLDHVRGATAFDYQQLEGNLMSGVRLQQVQFSMPGGEYRAASLELRWQPAGLVWGALVIDKLSLTGLQVRITSQGDQPDPQKTFSWPKLGLPVAIVVRDLSLQQGYVAINQQEYYLQASHASGRYGPNTVALDELSVRTGDSAARLSGSAALSFPYTFNAKLHWDLQPLPGDAHSADVMHWVPEPLRQRAPKGELTVNGDITQMSVNGQLSRPFTLALAGNYRTGLGAQAAAVEAKLSWPEQPLAALGLPLEALLGSRAGGSVTLTGWLDDYQAELNGDFIYPDYPRLALKAKVRGDTQFVQLLESNIGVAGAKLQASGRLDWGDALQWDVALNAQHLDPKLLLPEWPGNLQVALSSQGTQRDGELDIAFTVDTLSGQLRGLAVSGQGALGYNREHWRFRDVALSLGANRVALNGELNDRYDIDFSLKAPILTQIDPSLGGSLEASGRLTGSLDNPKIVLNAEGDALQWQEYKIASVRVQSTSADFKNGRLALTAKAQQLSLGSIELEAVNASIDGAAAQHTLSLALRQDRQNELQLALKGGWSGQLWRGTLNQLQLRTGYAQTMNLRQPVALELAADHAHLEPLCLLSRRYRGPRADNTATATDTDTATDAATDATASLATAPQTPPASEHSTDLCLDGSWQAQGPTEANVSINRLPLALLRQWLKDEVEVEGYVHGTGTLRWPAAGEPVVDAALAAEDAALVYRFVGEEPDRYAIDDLHISGKYQSQRLRADIGLAFADYGVLRGQLNANTADRSLSGKLDIDLDNLSPLEAILPTVSNVHGSLKGALLIAGSLDAPSASIDLVLADGGLELPVLGVDLTALNATLKGDQKQLQLEARTSAGEGELTLQAQARDLLSAAWQIEAEIDGERAKVMATPTLTLFLSPDINVKMDAGAFNMSGRATVPEAHAVIATLPVTATKVSDDVIVIDADSAVKQSPGMALNMNLDVTLGDKVTLDAAGFKTRVGGNMSINKESARAMYAVGNIQIIDGRYQSFGQDLTIEKGTLSFQGPLDDPGLNVKATRKVEDVTVGLIIGGTLQQPVTEIFSRPQVSDSNAMSMLFTGKQLDGASSGEGAVLVNAIAKLGIKRGQFLADDIAGRFGLDELTIKADDDVKDSRLWLGKYITEDLYVHYAIGLFDSLSSVGLTYFLNDNFRIEAESGEVQSADLIFRMER